MKRARSSTNGARHQSIDAREVFDQRASQYDQEVDRSISFTGRDASFFAARKVALLDRLLQAQGHELSGASVLDVGCGTGTTDQHLVTRVKELQGVDLSEEMVAMARTRVPGASFESYDGEKLPCATGSFDLVIAICVLHHVPPAQQLDFADELTRVTRSGGLIAIFEHNPVNPFTRRAVRGCELDDGVELLSAPEVGRLLTDAGARVVRRDYFLFTPFGGKLGTSLDQRLRRLPLGGQHVVIAEAG
jgi:SAM-dependent methyltransferase